METLTMMEIFEKAALNTLMGMGTVFAVLIFIAYVISLLKYIPDALDKIKGKKGAAPELPSTIEEPEAEEEELVDDQELVAVIMAAIYASMEEEGGSTSRDGLVVRSIRKARKR